MHDKMPSAACVTICTSIALLVTLPFTTDIKGTGLSCGLASTYLTVPSERANIMAKNERRNTAGFKFDWFHLVLLYCMILKVYHRNEEKNRKRRKEEEFKAAKKQRKNRPLVKCMASR